MLQLLKGDILLKHGSDILSFGIETVTHSLFSHVAVVSDPEKEIVIEAEGFRNVGYRNMSDYKGECVIVRVKELSDEQIEQVISYLKKQFGKPYNYKEIFQEFERYVFGTALNPTDDERSFICSTLVNEAFKSTGIHLTNAPLPSPNDIALSDLVIPIGFY